MRPKIAIREHRIHPYHELWVNDLYYALYVNRDTAYAVAQLIMEREGGSFASS